jgi:2-phosphosulfolactate phosphatase
MQVDVALTPPSDPPSTQVCIVIDVLRATSSTAVLFARGLERMYVAPGIDEGSRLRQRLATGGQHVMLCGEVGGLPPAGYDFGNSPTTFLELEALPASAAVIATTNGTRALLACRAAPLTLAAAPLNAAAVTAAAIRSGHDALVVCAGYEGAPAADDALAAGLFVDRLVRAGFEPTPAASDARHDFTNAGDFAAALRATDHGRRLAAIEFDHDIDLCTDIDRVASVPRLRVEGEDAWLEPLDQ